MMKRLVAFALMLILALTPLTSFAQPETTQSKKDLANTKALSFSTTTLDGKTINSSIIKDYDLIVLNVWAEWCGPCVWELPFLQKISEKYKNVLILGLWWGNDVEEALETAAEAGVTYPLIHSTKDLDQYLYASQYIPHTLFFDRSGNKVGDIEVGAIDYNGWVQTIEKRLAMVAANVPTITQQPKDIQVKSGGKAKFTVKTKEKNVNFQWFSKAPGAEDWEPLNAKGGAKDTLTIVAGKENNGTQYRCLVKNATGGETYSRDANLTVKLQPPVIKTQPKNLNVKSGAKAKLSVKGSGKSITYTWYERENDESEWKAVVGGNRNTLQVVASKANSGHQYYCYLKNPDGDATSATATLTVIPQPPTIKTQPKDAKVKVGAKAKFKVKATPKNVTYQWYYRENETAEWKLIDGATKATYEIVAAEGNIGWQFRCLAKNDDGEAWSKVATLLQK